MTTHTTSRATTAAAHTTDWMNDGLCRQTGAALFFPEGRGGAIAVQIACSSRLASSWPPTSSNEAPGTIIIETSRHALYLVLPGGKAMRYPVGVGKVGRELGPVMHRRQHCPT